MGYKGVWVLRELLCLKTPSWDQKIFGLLEAMGYQGYGLRGVRLYDILKQTREIIDRARACVINRTNVGKL